jgi:hypothetical protein
MTNSTQAISEATAANCPLPSVNAGGLRDDATNRRGRGADYGRVKLIVIVVRTGTGTPLSSVGLYSHCRTASSAA